MLGPIEQGAISSSDSASNTGPKRLSSMRAQQQSTATRAHDSIARAGARVRADGTAAERKTGFFSPHKKTFYLS